MGKFFEYDNESEIRDLIEDEVSDILSETSPLLDEVNTSTPLYKDSRRYRLVKRFADAIYKSIETQIDAIKGEASNQIEDLTSARDTHCSENIDLKEELQIMDKELTGVRYLIDEYEKEIAVLQHENQLFREGKHGTVHGEKFSI